jgi:hypothetical protein
VAKLIFDNPLKHTELVIQVFQPRQIGWHIEYVPCGMRLMLASEHGAAVATWSLSGAGIHSTGEEADLNQLPPGVFFSGYQLSS